MKKILHSFIVLSSIILSNAVEVTEEELNSFSYGPSPFKLAIIGDSGAVKEASEVMKLTSFDALLHLGDFDYDCHPDAYFDKILTSSRKFKFMGIIGNHDAQGQCGKDKAIRFKDNVYREMKKSNLECEYSDSKFMWSCRYHNMRIIGITPAISGADDRTEQLRFLKKHLSKSTEDWKVCAWHFYDKYYHTGKYQQYGNIVSGDNGESFYDYCKEYGAIIFSAHDHVYARTKVMTRFKTPKIDDYDSKTDRYTVQIRNGATLNILNGAGGYEMYEEKGEQKDYGHWQRKYALGEAKENAKRFGGLFCTFNVGGNNRKAKCEFLRINSSNKLFDNFTIYQNDNPSTVSYTDIDASFRNDKVKAYLASKGIIDKSLAPNSTSPHSTPIDPSIDEINVSSNNIYEDVNGNYEDEPNSIFTKARVIIGASVCAVVAIIAGGLIVLKMKKNKYPVDEPELQLRLPNEEFNYRKQLYANDNKSVVDDDFVPLPMSSHYNNYPYQTYNSYNTSKYNKYQ